MKSIMLYIVIVSLFFVLVWLHVVWCLAGCLKAEFIIKKVYVYCKSLSKPGIGSSRNFVTFLSNVLLKWSKSWEFSRGRQAFDHPKFSWQSC